MNKLFSRTHLSGARMVAFLFGILAGLGGLIHGIGEVIQGNVAPNGIFIPSWTQGPIATNMGGEPGITIIPNLILTGILTILVSLSILVWSACFVQKAKGGQILILLSILMLLFGGGIGPPIIGILAGIAGTMINAPLTSWREHLSVSARKFLARLWPWAFGSAAVMGTFLVIGSITLVVFLGFNNSDLFLNSFYLTVLFLIITVLMTPAYDIERRKQFVPAGDLKSGRHKYHGEGGLA